jgi:hypothetical protein
MFKVSKRQNAILLGLAITALVAIFCYQVAYGMTETVTGPYGITGTITAANGTKFTTKPTVTILNSSNFVRLDNTTWKFDTNNIWKDNIPHKLGSGKNMYGRVDFLANVDTFTQTVNGKTLTEWRRNGGLYLKSMLRFRIWMHRPEIHFNKP